MSEWITDRKPTREDADCLGLVWVSQDDGTVLQNWSYVDKGRAWMPTNRPAPYVKPKRWDVVYLHDTKEYCVVEYNRKPCRSYSVPTREAAERIAAIYEEVMP